MATPPVLDHSDSEDLPPLHAEAGPDASEVVVSPGGSALRISTGAGSALDPSVQWPGRAWCRWARVAVLVGADVAALSSALLLAYWVWADLVLDQPFFLYSKLSFLLPVFLLSYVQAGLYPGLGVGPVELLRKIVLHTSLVFLVLAAGTFVVKAPHEYSRVTFLLAWLFSVLLIPASRFALVRTLRGTAWWTEPVIVVRVGQRSRRHSLLEVGSELSGYRVVACIPHCGAGFDTISTRSICDLEAFLDQGIEVALVEGDERGEPGNVLTVLQRYFRRVILVRTFGTHAVEGTVACNLGGVLGIECVNQLLLRRNRLWKRCADLVLGALGLVIALPAIGLGALLVWIVDGGPPFYCQEREGEGGKKIKVWKIRTMRVDAEMWLERHLQADPIACRQWEERCKLARDPRIIPFVGSFLRRSSVDELPQFWNVVRGEMSLVGPRPFPDYHLNKFSPRFLELRRRVQPGVTGLWQVMVRSEGGIAEQEEFDSYYIHNWSLWMDLHILAKTFLVVARGRGAC